LFISESGLLVEKAKCSVIPEFHVWRHWSDESTVYMCAGTGHLLVEKLVFS